MKLLEAALSLTGEQWMCVGVLCAVTFAAGGYVFAGPTHCETCRRSLE